MKKRKTQRSQKQPSAESAMPLQKPDVQIEPAGSISTSIETLANRIAMREKKIDDLCVDAVVVGMRAVQLAFEQGDDLTEAKALCPHGLFGGWLADNFSKSWKVANQYMRLAEVPKATRDELLQDAKSLNDAFRVLGIISPEPPKQLTDTPSITLPPEVQKLNWIAEWVAREQPVFENMTPVARDELKARLRPVVEVYNRL